MKHSLRLLGLFSLASLACTSAAHAQQTFDFSASSNSYVSFDASGTLTAIPDPTLPGAFEVTGISGTVDGQAITGLCSAASTACTQAFNFDNLLYYPIGSSPSGPLQDLDDHGIAVLIGSTGLVGDFYASSTHIDSFLFSNQPSQAPMINAGFEVTPTPEPNDFLLFGTGLLGIAAAFRRRLKI